MDAQGPHRRAYRQRMRRLVRACRGRRLFHRRQHAGRRGRARRHREGLCAPTPASALRAAADRGDAGGRSRRRRQARQAIGGAADPRRGGMVRLSTCASTTTPIRLPNWSGSSTSAASAGCISANSCRRGRIPAGITDRAIDRCRRSQAAIGEQGMTASPLIEIEDLRVHLPRRRRPHHPCGRQRRSQRRQRRDARPGRQIRLRQERDLARHHGAVAESNPPRSPARSASTASICSTSPDETLRDLRGNRLAMIFQEPMTSLNPSFTIGDQIIETILRHRGGSRRAGARARHRAAAPRPHPLARKAHRRISAQALRRHAPARDDRDGAGLRSRAC